MALPVYSTRAVFRAELAARLGFTANASASLNNALLNSFITRAQDNVWRRINWPQQFDQVDYSVAPSETSVAYPTELDPNRITAINVETDGDDNWYPVTEGISYQEDSITGIHSWPSRYEYQHDFIFLWPVMPVRLALGIVDITVPLLRALIELDDITQVFDGMRILVEGVGGMVQITDGIYTVGTIAGSTFELNDSADGVIDASAYTAYTSGGTVSVGHNLRFEGTRRVTAFASDSTTLTLPDDLLLDVALMYGKAHYRQPDWQLYQKEMTRTLIKLRGQEHGNRRYVPINRNRGGQSVEMIRPRLITD